MATDVVEAFPVVPQGIEIPTSLKDLKGPEDHHGKNHTAVLWFVE